MGSRTRQRDRYAYVASVGRYRDLTTGRYVPESRAMELMQAEIDASMEEMRNYLAAVLSEDTPYTVADWQQAMAAELRQLHGEMLLLSSGGRKNVTAEDWGALGQKLRDEYQFLQGFSEDIASGRSSDAQIDARMQMYADGAWNSFWRGKTAAMGKAGFTQERRVVDTAAEHCDDCVGYAARGWQRIGTLPEPGSQSQCRSRCRCSKEYK